MPDRKSSDFDIAVAGGGLGGLSLAIQAARAGYSVLLIEKEKYPFQRVCGEYISNESWNFLQDLGVPLSEMQLPQISQLLVSAPNGNYLRQSLAPGGFGMSRFFLDHYLSNLAEEAGVQVLQEIKVTNVHSFHHHFEIFTTHGTFHARVVAGAFGKRSNLDIKWKRSFVNKKNDRLNNYVGIKYHVSYPVPPQEIALHNFEEGYCGISHVEGGKQCLCYMTSAANLAKSKNNIRLMEETILMKNPFLHEIFTKAVFLDRVPVTISQISFDRKEQVEHHVLLVGDAAGMITPLCGNGMSMALHSSKLAFKEIHAFLQNKINRYEMESQYSKAWAKAFASRLRNGRILQHFFGKSFLSNLFVAVLKPFPKVISYLVRQTHGQSF